MVTPDFNKVTPVRKDTSVHSAEDTERKAPSGDFEKVAKEVDERERGGGDNDFSKKDKKKVPTGQMASSLNEDTPLLTPFQLARGQRENQEEQSRLLSDGFELPVDAPKPKKIQTQFSTPPEHPITEAPVVLPESKTTDTKVSRYNTEQPDLAEVNTFGSTQQPTYVPPVFAIDASMKTEAPAPVKTPQPMLSMQEVIDQIVEKVYTVKQTGETEVVVDLKGSLAGSRLTVTESSSAKGQFNITIDNLTGPNQALIEAHKAKIMDTLLESGVQVQRFTASTAIESSRINVATDDTRDRERQDRPQDDQPRDGKRQKSDDKT